MGLYHFPADLAQFVAEIAGGGPSDEAALARRVKQLSDVFVGAREWQDEYARDPDLRRAYLAYFLPVNLPKIQVALPAWVGARPGGIAGEALRVIDLGSGPGSALLGLLDFVRRLPPSDRPADLDLVALDQSFETLRDAERLVDRMRGTLRDTAVRFRPLRLDLVADRRQVFPLAGADGRFDLVIAANLLSEVVRGDPRGLDAALDLVEAAVAELLAEDGAVVVLEPGSREIARDLHRIRDRVVDRTGLHVLAPCLHDLPCPALATERDWCIHDLAWEPPEIVRRVDQRSGLRKSSLKFAYVVLARRPSAPRLPSRWRVVSDVLEQKGERRVYLCAEGRWITVGQLKRDESSQNARTFAALERGDLVEVDGLEPKGPLFRLPPGGSIRRAQGT